MTKKLSPIFVIVLATVLCTACLFAFTACNTSGDGSQPAAEVPDQSPMFDFIPNSDKASYTAKFTPHIQIYGQNRFIIPADVYIPSSYCGIPVTAFVIGVWDNFNVDDLLAIERIHIPSSITGGIFYADYKSDRGGMCSSLSSFTFEGSSNTRIVYYYIKDLIYYIEGRAYDSLTDYLDTFQYDNVFSSETSAREGIILLPVMKTAADDNEAEA